MYKDTYMHIRAGIGVNRDRALENVKFLVRLGFSAAEKEPTTGRAALHFACEFDQPDICKFLIQNGADVLDADSAGATPMHIAATKGAALCMAAMCQAINFVVINNMPPPTKGSRPVSKPALKKDKKAILEHKRMVREARKKSALSPYLNPQDPNGNTPLHIACEYGFSTIVDTLIGAGADTSIRNNDGKTPYHVCAEVGHAKIFEKMIYRGINTSEPTDDGHTCLHFCAINNDAELARLQLEAHPDPNPQTEE
jgi:tankyrase